MTRSLPGKTIVKGFIQTVLRPRRSATLRYQTLKPIPSETRRPFWSVMIPTYNRPEMLQQCLRSILSQNLPLEEMQITVIDNATPDVDLAALVYQVGGDRVEFYRQSNNVGFLGNFHTALEQSRGHYVHVMHDDDWVLPGFYGAVRNQIETYQTPLVFSRIEVVNHKGEPTGILSEPASISNGVMNDPLQMLYQPNTYTFNTMVVQRELYAAVGTISKDLYYASDLELTSRLIEAADHRVGFINEPLIMYRDHEVQGNKVFNQKPIYLNDYLKSFCIMAQRHPDAAVQLFRNLANVMRGRAEQAWARHDDTSAELVAHWAFRADPTTESLRYWLRCWRRVTKRRLLRPFAQDMALEGS